MNWRLIMDEAANGAWNMAVDEAMLLHLIENPDGWPTVRFYGWQPPCLSLGRFQEIDLERVQSAVRNLQSEIEVVRRPTGGRAVLHQYEVTYCVVMPEAILPSESRSVLGSYRWLSAAWVAGLHELQIHATLAKVVPSGRPTSANCFASTAQCDFLVEGKKLIGAAQCRQSGVILQHGSLLLDIDRTAWETLMGGSMSETVTLQSMGVTASRKDVMQALVQGLEQTAGVALIPGELTASEIEVAQRLHREKYTQSAWTRQGRLEHI